MSRPLSTIYVKGMVRACCALAVADLALEGLNEAKPVGAGVAAPPVATAGTLGTSCAVVHIRRGGSAINRTTAAIENTRLAATIRPSVNHTLSPRGWGHPPSFGGAIRLWTLRLPSSVSTQCPPRKPNLRALNALPASSCSRGAPGDNRPVCGARLQERARLRHLLGGCLVATHGPSRGRPRGWP